MAPKYVLTYFPIGGRAECARLMFRVAGVEFEDIQHPFEHFQSIKGDVEQFPLAQLPILEVDGRKIIHSFAICRYLAHEFGFYGENNKDRSIIDQVYETLIEHFAKVVEVMFNKELSEEQKKVKYSELFSSEATKRYYNFLTKILKAHSNGKGFFLGEKVSVADFHFFVQDDMMRKSYPTYLDAYPELKTVVERVKEIEAVKKHLETRKY